MTRRRILHAYLNNRFYQPPARALTSSLHTSNIDSQGFTLHDGFIFINQIELRSLLFSIVSSFPWSSFRKSDIVTTWIIVPVSYSQHETSLRNFFTATNIYLKSDAVEFMSI